MFTNSFSIFGTLSMAIAAYEYHRDLPDAQAHRTELEQTCQQIIEYIDTLPEEDRTEAAWSVGAILEAHHMSLVKKMTYGFIAWKGWELVIE